MMKPTVYIETTIVSYLTAWPSRDIIRLSHEMITREWWDTRRAGFDLFISEFVLDEASRGDPTAAKQRLEKLANMTLLHANPEAMQLSQRLEVALQLPARARIDAAHLAVAAVHGVAFLLTWNCTHLANGMLADKIEETCRQAGFKAPRILTPIQLMEQQ